MSGPSPMPKPPAAAPWTPGPPSLNSSNPPTPTRPWRRWRPRSATTHTTNTSTSGSCACRPPRAGPTRSAAPWPCWKPGSPNSASPLGRRPARPPLTSSAHPGCPHPRGRRPRRPTARAVPARHGPRPPGEPAPGNLEPLRKAALPSRPALPAAATRALSTAPGRHGNVTGAKAGWLHSPDYHGDGTYCKTFLDLVQRLRYRDHETMKARFDP